MKKKFNQIIHGDCLEVMSKLPDELFDLVITSPPYNIKNSTGGGLKSKSKSGRWHKAELINGYLQYSDNMAYEDYIEWQRLCLNEMMRLIPENGAIFYNHKWRVQNGLIQDRHEILEGFPVRQIIIWQRAGGLNFNDTYFLPTYEVIYLIAKPKFRLKRSMCRFGDIWKFNQDMNNKHPAPFPIALPDRILKATEANKILDPFMGSGTTAIACLINNRKYFGIEQSDKYIQMAETRIREHKNSFGESSLFGGKVEEDS